MLHRMKNVGLVGFEPTASASRTQRSTKLSHSPNLSRDAVTPDSGHLALSSRSAA